MSHLQDQQDVPKGILVIFSWNFFFSRRLKVGRKKFKFHGYSLCYATHSLKPRSWGVLAEVAPVLQVAPLGRPADPRAGGGPRWSSSVLFLGGHVGSPSAGNVSSVTTAHWDGRRTERAGIWGLKTIIQVLALASSNYISLSLLFSLFPAAFPFL